MGYKSTHDSSQSAQCYENTHEAIDCVYDVHLGGSKFKCSSCGRKQDATARVHDDKVSSSASAIDRGRTQKGF